MSDPDFVSAFWADLTEDMKTPSFAAEYARATTALATHRQLIHKGRKP